MKTKKEFDCVDMQRKIRENILKESDYDFEKLYYLIKEKSKSSILFKYLKEKHGIYKVV